MGKRKKQHRKKVALRNEAIKAQQRKYMKAQEEFIKELIAKEQAEGRLKDASVSPLDPNSFNDGDVQGPIL